MTKTQSKILQILDWLLLSVAVICGLVLLAQPFGGIYINEDCHAQSAYNPAYILFASIIIRFAIVWVRRGFQARSLYRLIFLSVFCGYFLLWQMYQDQNPTVAGLMRSLGGLKVLFSSENDQSFHFPTPTKDWKPKRVLLITCDTTRADRLGCYGYSKALTPNIDRLAKSGILFKNHYAQASVTGPSHASIFTGKYPTEHGVVANGVPLPLDQSCLAELFQEQGYETVAWVATNVLNGGKGYSQGFDHYSDTIDEYPQMNENKATKQTNQAIRYFRENPDKKVFAFLHYFDPHAPYRPPQEYRKLFLYKPNRNVQASMDRLNRIKNKKIVLSDSELQDIQALYDGEVSYMDREIGRLFGFLANTRLLEDTLIVLTADHGEELYDHDFFFQHNWSIYEGVIHVPLILYSTELARHSGEQESLTESVDLFPTILSLCDIAPPAEGYSGQDFSSDLRNGNPIQSKKEVFSQRELIKNIPPAFALRRDNWKVLWFEDKPNELFNLVNDPREKENRIEEQSNLANEFLFSLQERLGDLSLSDKIVDPAQFSPEEIEQLKALGYLN